MEEETHAGVSTSAHGTDGGDWTGGAKADNGIHDKAAVASTVADESARVAAAGVAGDAVSTDERIASSRIRQVEEARSHRYDCLK